jgi:hypothetical protein
MSLVIRRGVRTWVAFMGTWSCLVHDVSTFHCKRLRIRKTVTISFQVSSSTTSQVIQVHQNFLEVEEVNKDRISVFLLPLR